ncbi:D-erythronate dehydrogenase [Larkinella soli]|uniref:D-erythronate dehydrogenase n=1 Tax=Larkinella soli TaxID=1770527 RepID=UPI000FFC8B74|nr:D-erythronate dehydrogenase [Larkinella soli]
MQIIITGGAGFLGRRLAQALLNSSLSFDTLELVDIVPPAPVDDVRVTCRQADLSEEGAVNDLITADTGLIFHLAAVVSSHAEKDFDLGWKVNLDLTRQLLEACRHRSPGCRFVFASSLAVYGGRLPEVVTDTTAVMPRSSYGSQKAAGELLVNDYSRKGFADGRVLRLPTVCVRPGRPNQAASSFVSGIIREPIQGEPAVCPVSPDLLLWLSSPDTIVENILKAATLDAAAFGDWRTVNLPGIGVTVAQMLDSLERVAGREARERVTFRYDAAIDAIVSSWPGALDNRRALEMGFRVDGPFDGFITQFMSQNQL